jgi:hypothetical protein
MKNKWIMALLISTLFCFVSIGLFAQSSNKDPRFVGTWGDGNGTTWVFNSNGSGTYAGNALVYVAFSGKIIVTTRTYDWAFEYYFSGDDKTIILFSGDKSGYFLTKKD